MKKKDFRRAAYRLKQWADVLRESYRGSNEPEAAAALQEADEMMDLSRKLYAHARACVDKK